MAAERWGEAPSRSLGTWLRSGVPDWFRDLGWESLTTQSMAGARGEAIAPENLCSRRLSIAGEPFELIIAALPEHEQTFRFELRSLKLGSFIPQGYRLRLLTADLQPFDNNEAIASNPMEVLQVDVMLAPDDVVVWEISPTPDQFDYECFNA